MLNQNSQLLSEIEAAQNELNQSQNNLINFSERPTTGSNVQSHGKRGYNYFYGAKQVRNYTTGVEKIDQFMKDLDQQKREKDQMAPFTDNLKDFPFQKEFQEYLKSKLPWQFYERQWDIYLQRATQANLQIELPLPPCKYGLFFYLKDKIYNENQDKIKDKMSASARKQDNKEKDQQVIFENTFANKKLMKKVKQEIMRRYHPDKHQQYQDQSIEHQSSTGLSSLQITEEINEICRINNFIYEATLKL
eukprot:403348930